MYRVVIDGVVKEWFSLEYALTDLFSRGWGHSEWALYKVAQEVTDNDE